MKILKIFGIVAGVHAIALLLIFANPGCSKSSAETAAPAASPAAAPAPAPETAAPAITAPVAGPEPAPITAPVAAAPEPAPAAGSFYTPTRPGTPAASALQSQPVTGVTPATAYTVSRGDSLWLVAKKNHLKISELAAANNLKPGATLQLGQRLVIPSRALPAETASASFPAPAPSASGSAAPVAGNLKHVVKPGETLGSIARQYGVKLGALAALNAISDPKTVHPGLELAIPAGGRAPAARAPKAAAGNPKPEPAAASQREPAAAS